LDEILQLRYLELRAPWNQSKESATDEAEGTAYNGYIVNEKNELIACARLQENEFKTGQIRYMAVLRSMQGQGLGKQLLSALEVKAKEMGLLKIELHARENAVQFYQSMAYQVDEKSYLLWEQIQHYKMSKLL